MTQIQLPFGKKRSVKQKIVNVLRNTCAFYTGFELQNFIPGATEGSVSKRCRELRADGKIKGRKRDGTQFVEWYI